MSAIDIRSALIASVSVLVIIAVIYGIWKRRSSINGDPEKREQTQEELRLESNKTRRSERVGFVSRARVQPTTTLLFFACVVAFFLVVAVGVYQVAKTGSPQEMAYADQLEFGVSALIFIWTGIWFKVRQDRQAGELNITYEGETSNTTDTLHYDRSLVQPLFDDSGDRDALLVPVFKKNRILWLFWTPQLAADEDRVRDIDKNLPEDQVTYEVPLDQSTTWNQETGRINVRAKDKTPVSHPDRRTTYEFVPSDRKSDAEIQDILDENEQLRQDLKHELRMNGILSEQMEAIEEALQNRNYASLAHLNDSLEVVERIMESTNQQGNGHHDGRKAGSLNGTASGESPNRRQDASGGE